MAKLETARQLVRQCTLPKALQTLGRRPTVPRYAEDSRRVSYCDDTGTRFHNKELTAEVLAKSLHYLIRIDAEPIHDEAAVPLGASKYRGLPHLPEGMPWPKGLFFAAQFNVSELHPLDIHGAFPERGILYFFFNAAGDAAVLHHDGPFDSLRVTQYPQTETIPDAGHYLEKFQSDAALIRLQPQALFYLGGEGDDYSEASDLIPDALKRDVAAALGAPVVACAGERLIFGRPTYFQGEDEVGPRDTGERKLLLLQDVFADGVVHFWIDPAAAAKRDYRQAWIDYSGT